MKNQIKTFAFAIALLSVSSLHNAYGAPKAPSARTVDAQAAASSHTRWIAHSLREMQTIQIGMTRAQLLKVFRTEGGLSTRQWRRYVYRDCPCIKVNVRFKAYASSKYPHAESARDRIVAISQPFLEWSIMN